MMRLREEFDADRTETSMQVSGYPTEKARFEVYCDMCGEQFFVDEATSEKISHAIREGFDNPFVCEDCRGEMDELAYSER
jgi:predicted SprT family Zn-dependent metalloprotease